jgi:hypothetical protein
MGRKSRRARIRSVISPHRRKSLTRCRRGARHCGRFRLDGGDKLHPGGPISACGHRLSCRQHRRHRAEHALGVRHRVPDRWRAPRRGSARHRLPDDRENIRGSVIWDRLSNGAYVSDFFTTTPRAERLQSRTAPCIAFQYRIASPSALVRTHLHNGLYATKRGERPRSLAVREVCQMTPQWSSSRSR